MTKEFISICTLAFERGVIRKLVFSRPRSSEVTKVSGRICAHRGRNILALEYSLPGDTVRHKNLSADALTEELTALVAEYAQANLITTVGEVELRITKNGKPALLGADRLKRRLTGESPVFEQAIESLDRKKNYILDGGEDFLIRLGVSDKNGRVHDKRQGKFRQINRFLEHIEEIYPRLPKDGEILIYDLCCGKSYLSFAVYHYLTAMKGRTVRMLGIDLKRDVILWCEGLARELGYTGMSFIHGDVKESTPTDVAPDMVISLHACDIATDVVINRAAELRARVILSTPCCHRYLNDKIRAEALSFVTDYPQLRGKLCEALTDAIRLSRLSAAGYTVSALELTDPDDTPKNTLLRATLDEVSEAELKARRDRYESILSFVLGEGKDDYLREIR